MFEFSKEEILEIRERLIKSVIGDSELKGSVLLERLRETIGLNDESCVQVYGVIESLRANAASVMGETYKPDLVAFKAIKMRG